MMKAVADVAYEVVLEGAFADKLLASTLQQYPKWGRRDRSFVVETTQDVLRHFRYLAHLSGQDYRDRQLNMWGLLAAWCMINELELPVWEEFTGVDIAVIEQRMQQPSSPAERLSVPDWLYNIGAQQLQQRWDTELEAMNQPAKLVIRVNTLKSTVEKLAARLATQEILTERVPEAPDALVLTTRKYLMNLPEFNDGLFEVQDAASQLVALAMDVQPGMMVVDACAGGGGKTLHMANLMRNKGHIVACDVETIKLASLRKRLQRTGYTCVEPKAINPQLVSQLLHKADRLLLDVPCSGLGVLKRNPDTKWLLTEAELAQVTQTQRQILANYHTMLKPGGKLVYATCSLLPQEDEQQVQWFVQQHPEYQLLQQQYVWPSEFGFDGFYIAVLQKG